MTTFVHLCSMGIVLCCAALMYWSRAGWQPVHSTTPTQRRGERTVYNEMNRTIEDIAELDNMLRHSAWSQLYAGECYENDKSMLIVELIELVEGRGCFSLQYNEGREDGVIEIYHCQFAEDYYEDED